MPSESPSLTGMLVALDISLSYSPTCRIDTGCAVVETADVRSLAGVAAEEIIQRVDVGAHTPRTRGSAGAPPLGEGARSLWAPCGASHSYMRSSDLVHHLRRIRETHALRASDVT